MENQNYGTPLPPSSPIFNSPEAPKSNSKAFIITLIIIIAIFLITVGVFAGTYIFNNNPTLPSISTSATTTNSASKTSTTNLVLDNVTWNTPEALTNIKLVKDGVIEEDEMNPNFNPEGNTEYFKVGIINSGQYQGAEIILVNIRDGESLPYLPSFHFLKYNNNYILLKKNSEGYLGYLNKDKFTTDENYSIAQLDFPKIITVPNGKGVLQLDPYVSNFFTNNNLKKVFTDPQFGDVYTSLNTDPTNKDLFAKNGFYIKAPDGTVRVYSLKPDFIPEGQSPQITWLDGTKNETDYSHTDRTGCGSSNYVSVVSINNSDLKITGKTSSGDDVYEINDPSNKLLKDLYNIKYQVYGDATKVSYQEFIANHPMFFWRDSFGRLIKFENSKYGPTAECGKPVIYLYPTKTEKVDVKVEPQGGLTYSDPLYKSGWSVIAKTNGELTEVSSGKSYPYLFWEGRGGIYEQPKRGFVVRQDDVHNFLVTKLDQFGLNTKESADFIDFWEPKMQGSPYYFVSFLGTSDMNKIAPLTITPKPDTVIRILMDFSPLEKPIEVESYKITTPKRSGFTVIEWGGVLR